MVRLIFSLLLLSFSFGVSAGYTIRFCPGYVFETNPKFDHSLIKSCLSANGITYVRYSNAGAFWGKNSSGREHRYTFHAYGGSCPSGQSPNSSGKCEQSCADNETYNPVTGQCEQNQDEGFCESDDFQQILFERDQSCASDHPDYFTSVEVVSCTDADNYEIKCNQGTPRPDPDPDPDNGDSGSGGGSGSGGDNENPDNPDSPDYSEIVSAIDGMKLDNNSRLDNLDQQLQSLNSKQSDVKQSIDNASAKNKESLDKIETAVGDVDESIEGLKTANQENSNSEVAALGAVRDNVSGVTKTLKRIGDAIYNVDASSVGTGVCAVGTCESLYESEYPDGLGGVMSGHFETMKGQFTQGIAESFDAVDFGHASRPNYVIRVDLGPLGNYGSYDVFALAYLDMIFAFGRILFMSATIFYCRGLVMGG